MAANIAKGVVAQAAGSAMQGNGSSGSNFADGQNIQLPNPIEQQQQQNNGFNMNSLLNSPSSTAAQKPTGLGFNLSELLK